jgi:hypothetical protein
LYVSCCAISLFLCSMWAYSSFKIQFRYHFLGDMFPYVLYFSLSLSLPPSLSLSLACELLWGFDQVSAIFITTYTGLCTSYISVNTHSICQWAHTLWYSEDCGEKATNCDFKWKVKV